MINNVYSYKEIDIEEDLEIVSDRISTSKRIKNIDENIGTSQPRKSVEYQRIKEIEPYHYYITRIKEQRKHIIIINTGQEENYIPREFRLR